jgi:hypothetical protein
VTEGKVLTNNYGCSTTIPRSGFEVEHNVIRRDSNVLSGTISGTNPVSSVGNTDSGKAHPDLLILVLYSGGNGEKE